MGTQATIAFGLGETIENVAIGDSTKWQITPNRRADLLFVKPLEATARTNMTVITNKREYFFDLAASPGAKAIYMLRFSYAADNKRHDATDGVVSGPSFDSLNGEKGMVANASASDPAMLNFDWQAKGDRMLFPERMYDDGGSTYLSWSQHSEIPAILVTNEQGIEGPVNYAVRGTTIVIADVPGRIVLRSGKDAAVLSRQESAKSGAKGVNSRSYAISSNAVTVRNKVRND
jgi:type IV secretion system protein VirB9